MLWWREVSAAGGLAGAWVSDNNRAQIGSLFPGDMGLKARPNTETKNVLIASTTCCLYTILLFP